MTDADRDNAPTTSIEFINEVRGRTLTATCDSRLEAPPALTGPWCTFKDDSQGWLDHAADIAMAQLGGTNNMRDLSKIHEIEVIPADNDTGSKPCSVRHDFTRMDGFPG